MDSNASEPESDKAEIYRAYIRGDATEEEVREVFGEEFEEFEARRDLLDMMKSTPTNEPSDDLLG